MNTFQNIYNWFTKAIPEPSLKNQHTQLGVHLEEVGEMLLCLPRTPSVIAAQDALEDLQLRLKDSPDGIQIRFDSLDRVSVLDSLCDQIVTAIGVARMLEMDIIGALAEVSASNDSKFDENGNPIFNEQLKISKGPNYFKPDLNKYV